jgi:hypothetical protein
MNTMRLCGGLGNQLFQYAFGKAMQHTGTTVTYDVDWYERKKDIHRPYLLDKFHTEVSIDSLKKYKRTFRENGFNLKSLYVDGCNCIGYWQSPLYIQKIASILKIEFCVKEEFYTSQYHQLKDKIQNTNSVSLHVRRGDYLAHKNHLVLPLEYYSWALKMIQSLKGDCEVFVFSDDIPWCKEHLPNFNYVEIDDYLSFELMKFSKYKIIGNSTFSWWAAYLSDSMVIAPKRWVVKEEDQKLVDKKGLILNDWIKL